MLSARKASVGQGRSRGQATGKEGGVEHFIEGYMDVSAIVQYSHANNASHNRYIYSHSHVSRNEGTRQRLTRFNRLLGLGNLS